MKTEKKKLKKVRGTRRTSPFNFKMENKKIENDFQFYVVIICVVLFFIALYFTISYRIDFPKQESIIKTLEIDNLEIRYKNNTLILEDLEINYDGTKLDRLFLELESLFEEETFDGGFLESEKELKWKQAKLITLDIY